MTLSVLALAQLAGDAYRSPASFPAGDVHACVTEHDDAVVIAFRGTMCIADWIRDAAFVPSYDPRVGSCHAGFLGAARMALPFVRNYRAIEQRPLILVGHSLGGGEVLIVGGLLVAVDLAPARIVTFGAPRAGFSTLAKVLADVPVEQYRNGNDPIPEIVPWPYHHVREPLIAIGAGALDPLDCHHMDGRPGSYVAALEAAATASAASASGNSSL